MGSSYLRYSLSTPRRLMYTLQVYHLYKQWSSSLLGSWSCSFNADSPCGTQEQTFSVKQTLFSMYLTSRTVSSSWKTWPQKLLVKSWRTHYVSRYLAILQSNLWSQDSPLSCVLIKAALSKSLRKSGLLN